MISCEYCEFFKNICFEEHLRTAASAEVITPFFYQDFLSQTLTIHKTAGVERGLGFIPLYHFHFLTKIQTFICNFACETRWLARIFNRLVTTRLLLDEIYHLIKLPLDDAMLIFVCLLDDLILGFC